MKRGFSFLAMALLALAGLASVSCVEPDNPQPDKVTPVFPEAVTKTLDAGGSHTLNLEPNADWEIELKYDNESAGWFWIQDGNSQGYSLRGKADEKVTVTVVAGDQTDYDKIHTCTLEMTMGEETKTIATFSRGTSDRTFSLAYCKVDETGADYVYNETESDLQYSYENALEGDKPVIPLAWLERTQDFRRSVLINANFDWRIKSKPEWLLDLRVTDGLAGEQVEFDLEGDPVNYPLEDETAEIIFCAKENTEAEYIYRVQIPGCGDIFQISGFQEETQANKNGEIWKESSMGEGSWAPAELGVTGYVLGVDGVKVYVFASVVDDPMTGSRIWDCGTESTAWIDASLTDWDNAAGVLQSRELTIKVTENSGEAREAYVFAMPASAAPASEYSIFPDGLNMAEKYAEYVVSHVVQASVDSDPGDDPGTNPGASSSVSFVSPETVSGAVLEAVTKDNLADMIAKYPEIKTLNENVDGNGLDVVILKYTEQYPENAALVIPEHKWIDLKPGMEGPGWLSYIGPSEVDGEQQIVVNMAKPEEGQETVGIINIYESYSAHLPSAVIYCIPAFATQGSEPVPEIDSAFSFATPDQVAGATLEPVAKSNLADMMAKYPQIKELNENVDGYGIDVVILKYTSATPENVAIVVPDHKWIDLKPGMEGPEWLTYDEPVTVDGKKQMTVHMAEPAEDQASVGIMNFYESYSASMPFAIVYCIPEF